MDFSKFFEQYEALVKQVESVFDTVQQQHSECVRCKPGCADCCHAVFDLTLIEALYIKFHFERRFEGEMREPIIERANKADRTLVRLKRQAYKEHQEGKSEAEILKEMAAQRIACPLLDREDRCLMYDVRPLTCRLYGIPTQIGEEAHSCRLSAFEPGRAYPTVKMEGVHRKLYSISLALAAEIRSQYPQLAEILVPLSMALLTDYTEEYLGVKTGDAKAAETRG
jgi:Fe-S-cluster containining protein